VVISSPSSILYVLQQATGVIALLQTPCKRRTLGVPQANHAMQQLKKSILYKDLIFKRCSLSADRRKKQYRKNREKMDRKYIKKTGGERFWLTKVLLLVFLVANKGE
jgi:hypothetical protein